MKRRRAKKGERKNARRIRTNRAGERAPEAPGTAATRPAEAAAASARPAGRPWWERFPGRLEHELRELEVEGWAPRTEVCEGRMQVRVTVPIAGKARSVVIQYPDLYPYFRFEVLAPLDLGFRKHQNPYAGNLCLLDRSTAAWSVDDTPASVLKAQLPKIEGANLDPAPRPDLEVPQAEPVSTYFEAATLAGSLIVMPPEAYDLPFGKREGTLQLMLGPADGAVRGLVSAVDGRRGSLPPLQRALGTTRSLGARWVRLDAPPPVMEPRDLVPLLLGATLVREPQLRDGEDELTGLMFTEEVAYGGESESTWLFLRWLRRGNSLTAELVRAERYDPADQAARIPHLLPLREKSIVLFGLGGVGASLAHHLLQMRVGKLRLVDYDLVRLGNAVRWPLGFSATGLRKGAAFAKFAAAHYPETQLQYLEWRVGQSALGASPDESALLDEAVAVDLIVDATAELGVQYLLTDAARERGLPVITVEAREGGYGGIVARYRPARNGCYLCFKLHQQDGRFMVPHDPNGRTQPRGCADSAFTGGMFDLAPLSALAARLAAQTLVPSAALPDAPYDVALLFNRTDDGGGVKDAPRWEYATLEAHPNCPRCSVASAS